MAYNNKRLIEKNIEIKILEIEERANLG